MSSYSRYSSTDYWANAGKRLFVQPRKYLTEEGTEVVKQYTAYTPEQKKSLKRARERFIEYLTKHSKDSGVSRDFAIMAYSLITHQSNRAYQNAYKRSPMFHSNSIYEYGDLARERETRFLCVLERWLTRTGQTLSQAEKDRITKYILGALPDDEAEKRVMYKPFSNRQLPVTDKWEVKVETKTFHRNKIPLNPKARSLTMSVKSIYFDAGLPLKVAKLLYRFLNNIDADTMDKAKIDEFDKKVLVKGKWCVRGMYKSMDNFNRWNKLMKSIQANYKQLGCKNKALFDEAAQLLVSEMKNYKEEQKAAQAQRELEAQKRREERAAKKAAEKKRQQEEDNRRNAENSVFDIFSI